MDHQVLLHLLSEMVGVGMNKNLVINRFDDSYELDKILCIKIVNLLKKSIEKNKISSLIVSGGSTPKNLFFLLSKEKLDWSKVYITLADERLVDVYDKDSNERMVKELLLQNEAKVAKFIGLKQDEDNMQIAEKKCDKELKKFPFPATVCLLGMGEDGHTASLFPNSNELASIIYEKQRTCKICKPKFAPHSRITLTPECLGASENIFLHVVGRKKQEVLNEALEKGDVFSMPIRLFLTSPKLEVFVA